MKNELDLTLSELEGESWGPPNFGSHLVTECHRLRKQRLRDFTVADLQLMIGQNFSLKYLMLTAIARLNSQPLAEGDYYPGDLLCCVLRVKPEYWKHHPAQRQEVREIADRAIRELQQLGDPEDVGSLVEQALSDFRLNE